MPRKRRKKSEPEPKIGLYDSTTEMVDTTTEPLDTTTEPTEQIMKPTLKELIDELPTPMLTPTQRWYGETFYPTYKKLREQLRDAMDLK